MSSSSSSTSSSFSSASSQSSLDVEDTFNWPPPGYNIDSEGRIWKMSSSSHSSSQSSSESSLSSSLSSSDSSCTTIGEFLADTNSAKLVGIVNGAVGSDILTVYEKYINPARPDLVISVNYSQTTLTDVNGTGHPVPGWELTLTHQFSDLSGICSQNLVGVFTIALDTLIELNITTWDPANPTQYTDWSSRSIDPANPTHTWAKKGDPLIGNTAETTSGERDLVSILFPCGYMSPCSSSSSVSSLSSISSSVSSSSSLSSSSSSYSSSQSSMSSSSDSSESSSMSSSSSSHGVGLHYPPDGYDMDNEGRIFRSSLSSILSSSSSFRISDFDLDSDLDAILNPPASTNDVDLPETNDSDLPQTNDADPTDPQEDACFIVVENVNNNFVLHNYEFKRIGESRDFKVCDYSHSSLFVGLGSFIFDVYVDVDNNTIPTNIDRSKYTNLPAGGIITLTETKTNLRFTGKSGESARIYFDPQQAAKPTPEQPEQPPKVVCEPAHGCLTSNDSMRKFLLDRMVDDNSIDLDLFFTDAELDHARFLAVAYWNEIPPYVGGIKLTTCTECLPHQGIFVHGIAYYAYLSKLQKLQKEDLDYNAGGMQVDLIKRRIAHITGNIKAFKEDFTTLAQAKKVHINYQSAWGQVG